MIVNPFYFILSFAIGLFIVYIFHPPPQVVVKFPSPYNVGKIIYKDKHESCYAYKAVPQSCDTNTIPQPLFEDFRNQGRQLHKANETL
jgi:hypothetical protein